MMVSLLGNGPGRAFDAILPYEVSPPSRMSTAERARGGLITEQPEVPRASATEPASISGAD